MSDRPSTITRDLLAGLALALAVLAGSTPPAVAGIVPDEFLDAPVDSGFDQPVNFDFLPDGRVLVVEQRTARIRVVVPGAPVQPAPVGTVSDVRIQYVDQGLLGIAVDPRWPEKPYVYVHHSSASTPNLKIARYAVTGDLDFSADGALTLDSLSRRDVLGDLPDDNWLHNGGTLEFGPDGFLYIALGDDGVSCSAPDIHQMRGKILRLEVRGMLDGPGPTLPYAALVAPGNPYELDEDPRARLVWHRGLRNPWSFDFDPGSGAMAIADVGEASWEEIQVTSTSARNFGWPLFEGPDVYLSSCPNSDLVNLTQPDYVYSPGGGFPATCILGGICYSEFGNSYAFPEEYWGDVFFLDFYNGKLQRLQQDGNAWAIAPPVPGQPDPDAWGTGFGFTPRMRFGPDGGLWYVQGTELRRVESLSLVAVPGEARPGRSRLDLRAWPSPATGPVAFEFRLAVEGIATMEIFDVTGRRVRRLDTGAILAAGAQRLVWDGRDDAGRRAVPGVYLGRLRAGGDQAGRRVVLVPPG